MNIDLGLNINNFSSRPKAQAKGESQNSDFQSQLNGEMEAESIGSKPVPGAGFGQPSPQMSSFGGPMSANELIPQPTKGGLSNEALNSVAVDGLTRRVAWQKFLAKMQSELNVSAEDLMFAFQSLSPEELAQPPELSVEKIVENLDLNPAQSQVAQQLFQDLLSKTGSRPLGQELTNSKREISLSVMSQRDQEQKRLNDTLNQMTQKFFMKADVPVKDEKDPAAVPQGEVTASAEKGFEIPKGFVPVAPQAFAAPQISVPNAPQTSQAPNASQALVQEAPKEVSKDAIVKSEAAPQVASAQATEANPLLVALNKLSAKAAEVSASPTTSTPAAVNMVNAPVVAPIVATKSEMDMGEFSDDEESSDLSTLDTNAMPNAVVGAPQDLTGKDFDSVLGTTLAADANAAPKMSTEDLIQKAQVMVRDGGGEVKVILQPEGLGEVAMKINVKGDKVNVEMITESDTAKKLLEKSVGDLRNHLHASQLNLESIKVDTASSMGQQLEQQYQDAHRNQAQQFMENFRQSNQEFRRAFNDLPGAKIYKGQSQGKAPDAIESTDKAKSSRRLNLVA